VVVGAEELVLKKTRWKHAKIAIYSEQLK